MLPNIKPKINNETAGGDPFANDAEWIPAHRFCTAKCDVGTHICMKHVKSEKQKCEKR